MTINNQTGILTLAFGPERYIQMAIRLAQSLMLNSPNHPRAIVTDRNKDELSQYFDIVIPYKPEYGRNLEQKLHLDLYTPFQRTMYIDSDCLVVKSLDSIFSMLRGYPLTTSDFHKRFRDYSDPNFEVNVNKVLDYFNIDFIYRFNGGLYYFESNSTSTKVFEQAREILNFYPELGIRQFRNSGPNEEILMGIAMRLNDLKLFRDNGALMKTPKGLIDKIEIDVFQKYSRFNKKGRIVSPAIVHYCGGWVSHPTYVREVFKLQYVNNYKENYLPLLKILLPLIYLRAQLAYSMSKLTKRFQDKYARLTEQMRQSPKPKMASN